MADIFSPSTSVQMLDPVGKLFADAWRLYKEHFLASLEILLIPAVVIGIGQIISSQWYPLVVGGVLLNFIGILTLMVGMVALIFSISKGVGVGESYRSGIKLFWSLIWIVILTDLIVTGGFVMIVVPGIMMLVWFQFSNYILVIEDKRGLSALEQSREYVRGYWWPVFGRSLLLLSFTGILYAIFYIIPMFLIFGKVIDIIAYIIMILFITPFSIAYSYKLYQNLTILKPTLLMSQPTSIRGFLITSAIVGFIAPVILIALIILIPSLLFPGIFHSPTQSGLLRSLNSASIPSQTNITESPPVSPIQNVLQSELFQQALPRSPIHDVYIGSYGNIPTSTLEQIKSIFETTIGVKTSILQRSLDPFPEKPPFYNSMRQQYDGDYIWQSLIYLEKQYGTSVRIITFVDADLFTNIQSSSTEQYVFSRALPNVNAAVVSLYRIKQISDSSNAQAPQDLVDSRLKRLALRTLGVTVGFSLSPSANDISCVMYQALNLADLDKKGDSFCKPEISAMSQAFQISTSTIKVP